MPNHAPGIQTLLLDADGVVQTTASAFVNDLQALCPDLTDSSAFLEDIFNAEKPCLVGESYFPDELTRVLRKWKVDLPVSDALDLWHQIEPVPAILNAVSLLRQQGIRVCLATNQQSHRASIMAKRLRYASLFDELFFSFELGVAKPSPAFFTAILSQLQTDAKSTLFIDDHAQNVAGAEAIGIHAEVYHADHGAGVFTSILERYGLPV